MIANRDGVGRPTAGVGAQHLQAVRLIAQHEFTTTQIMRVADVSLQTVFTYRDKVIAEGAADLLQREWKVTRVPTVRCTWSLPIRRASLAAGQPTGAGQRAAPAPAGLQPGTQSRERFGGLLKAQVTDRLYPSLRRLEEHLFAASWEWTQPAKVAALIHDSPPSTCC